MSEHTNEAPDAALQAAAANEQNVTAWVTLDVEKMRQLSARQQADIVRDSANMIRDSLMTELAKHGIHVGRPARQLRKR